MTRWHALLPNWTILIIVALIFVLPLFSSYHDYTMVSDIINMVLIPVILISYFFKQKIMANVFFTTFALLFLGLVFSVINDFALSEKLSELCFLAAYTLLVFVMIGRLRHVKFEGIISWYLTTVLLVSAVMMFILFASIQDRYQDSVILTLAVSKGVALLIMAFFAFALYLAKETMQSILFLTVICCFVFADILSYATTMIAPFWLFECFETIFQGYGLLLMSFYVFNHQQIANGNCAQKQRMSTLKTNQMTA